MRFVLLCEPSLTEVSKCVFNCVFSFSVLRALFLCWYSMMALACCGGQIMKEHSTNTRMSHCIMYIIVCIYIYKIIYVNIINIFHIYFIFYINIFI